ncbi:hypothetical protein GDO81_006590 [Engystomops pustulosus]|uniref:Adhesion G-protein coupled receptor G2 n=1 Tax=Engystomops pustulosus TaxID=76066 RepID=A0AAV7CZ73_ENGPU|nr:hypothetical protein GDO81_006590 [Engystomops pustulosus]
MFLHGFLSAVIGKTKHRPVKLKNIQPICILMCILTLPKIAHAAKFDYKAVFTAPCKDIMTLSTPVPELSKFTVCTYIKLTSSNPWTAFTYQLLNSSVNTYEIGVLGDSSSLKIWIFGTQINVIEKLNLQTWYEICIMWDGSKNSVKFYLDGTLKESRNLENKNKLVGGGRVVLGCPHLRETNDSVSLGLVGDIYMFRMWSIAQDSLLQTCIDGNVIKWKMENWIYSSNVVLEDSSLHCAKESEAVPSDPTTGVSTTNLEATISSTSIPSLVSPAGSLTTGTDASTSSSSTYSVVETTNITTISEFTIGTSSNTTLWTSENDTFTSSSTFSSTSVTTNMNNGSTSWSSGVTYLTSEFSKTTSRSLNCTDNDTSAFQNWQSDICKNCSNGTAYEIILKTDCGLDNSTITRYIHSYNFTSFFVHNCSVLVYGINETFSEICQILKKIESVASLIQAVKKVDYNCCCQDCLFFTCIPIGEDCLNGAIGGNNGGSGGNVTIQYTALESTGITFGTAYSGPSVTSSKGSSATVNIISNATIDAGLSTTIGNTKLTSDVTLTINSKSETTLNHGNTTANSGPNTTYNRATTPGINISGDQGAMTTSNKELNGTFSTESQTTGTLHQTTLDIESHITTGTTTNKGSNTTNSGTTGTTHNTAINTGPISTSHSGSETTYWSNHNVTSVSSTSIITTILNNITDEDLQNMIEMIKSGNINSSTVDLMVSKLETLLLGKVNRTTADMLLGVLNSFLNVSQTLLGPVSNRLIKIVDKVGLQLTFPGESINLTSQSLALAVNKVNASSFAGTSFGVDSSSGLQVSLGSQAPGNSDGSILLPASLLKDISPGDKKDASSVQFNYYAKTSFFEDSSLNASQQLVSKVISSSVANLSITNLSENITITLKTLSKNSSDTRNCVFWDFNKNNRSGGWSSDGCFVANTTEIETVCKCNHLTSFAILMNVSPNSPINPEDLLILTFITYIGCGLSAIFLSVTLITYIVFEKIRRDYPSKILIQLCAALVCLNLTFLLNPWIALYKEIPGLCISVAAFLHYFVLVSITWMGLEAFHMYLSLVKVFNTYVRKYMLKFCIVGWGTPAVVVAIILAINKNLYYLRESDKYPNGSTDNFCWVDTTVFWITVVGYFAIIFLLNVSMFVVVLIQLCRIKKQKQLGYQRKTTLQDLRSVAGITFLLGITWGLGFFSFGPGRTVIMYLFTIFNSLQGFFIFFFYCVAKENVRKQWRRYLCCGKFRLAENSDWSKTATNKLRKQTSKQGVSSSSSNSIQSSSNTNSTTLLVNNEYSLHPNGNGNVLKERNGVSFMAQNGEMPLEEIAERPSIKNNDTKQKSLRRTSNRGSVHFMDQI